MIVLKDAIARIHDKVKELISDSCNMDKMQKAANVITDYFGEDRVDFQDNVEDYIRSCIDNEIAWMLDFMSINLLSFNSAVPNSDYKVHRDTKLREAFQHDEFLDWVVSKITVAACQSLPLYSIIIRFNDVIVSNGKGDKALIQEIYVKVPLKYNGNLYCGMWWLRTTYSYYHWRNNYAHSHLGRISTSKAPTWKNPCTGDGPINLTMDSLRTHPTDDLWALFCYELEECIKVESLAGGPYIRIDELYGGEVTVYSDLGITEAFPWDSTVEKELIQNVINSGKLEFKWENGAYSVCNSVADLMTIVSTEFFKICKEHNENSSLPRIFAFNCYFYDAVISGQNIKVISECSNLTHAVDLNNTVLFTFKGAPVKLRILDVDDVSTKNTKTFLKMPYVASIISKINNLANYYYGNNKTRAKIKIA